MNDLMSNPLMWLWVRCCRVPMFTMKKNRAMKIGGITVSSSRGTRRSARPAMAATSRTGFDCLAATGRPPRAMPMLVIS